MTGRRLTGEGHFTTARTTFLMGRNRPACELPAGSRTHRLATSVRARGFADSRWANPLRAAASDDDMDWSVPRWRGRIDEGEPIGSATRRRTRSLPEDFG